MEVDTKHGENKLSQREMFQRKRKIWLNVKRHLSRQQNDRKKSDQQFSVFFRPVNQFGQVA